MNHPLVSFIIPVLNGQKDIGRCLTAVQNQHFSSEQYEVLVMDNGSTDGTLEIVRDQGFKVETVPGLCVAALRNKGAKIARGEFLAFVDADVEIMSDWLHEGLKVFQETGIVAAGCFPKAPEPATWVQKTWELHQRGLQGDNFRNPVFWLPSMNILVRRDAFLMINGFDEHLVTAEDVDLCYRLGQHGVILSIATMNAIHWGEAPDLRTFWRKEVWRGLGNLSGVVRHGMRRDELPSLAYPLYVLILLVVLTASCVAAALEFGSGRQKLYQWTAAITVTISLLISPALGLAARTAFRTMRLECLPKLCVLYLVYGIARAYSIAKGCVYRQVHRYGARLRVGIFLS